MNNYIIYIPISSIMRVFAHFKCFCEFRIYKLKRMSLEDVLRPCGSKKIAKSGPK